MVVFSFSCDAELDGVFATEKTPTFFFFYISRTHSLLLLYCYTAIDLYSFLVYLLASDTPRIRCFAIARIYPVGLPSHSHGLC